MTSSNAEGQRHSAAMTEGRGRNSREQVRGADVVTGRMGLSWPKAMDVMEAVVERENMRTAAKRVRSNKGVPGVDGMRVEDVWGYYGPHIEKSLLDGSYEPQPVLGVEIPKPGGGTRQLGNPHGHGPFGPAGAAPGAYADLQSRLLRFKLRVPSR